jgi:hypothetical protein
MKLGVAQPVVVAGAVFTVSLLALFLSPALSTAFPEFYASKLQMPLFTGLLTLGGFLLSLKTFILIKLKESLYENADYQDRLKKMQALSPKAKLTTYGPLRRLSSFLVYSVFGCLAAAVAQPVIGSFNYLWTQALSFSLALGALSLVFYAWWEIRANLSEWFSLLEKTNETNPGADN